MNYIQTLLLSLFISYAVVGQNKIESTGNVGIGTIDPLEKLQIGSGFTFHDGGHKVVAFGYAPWPFYDLNLSGKEGELRFDAVNGSLHLGVGSNDGSYPSRDLNIINNGNVGIGTAQPKSKLYVLRVGVNNVHYLNTANVLEATDSRLQILSKDSGNASSLLFLSNAPEEGNNKHWGFHHTEINRNDCLEIGYGTSTSDGEFWDLGAKMTILTDGNVGVVSASPEYKLHVLDNNVPNSHYLKTANVFENTESRLQILAADTDNASAMLFLSNAPSSGNNKHWSLHDTGANRNDRFEIGLNTSSASGDFWDTSPKLAISTDGDVGIRTTNTQGFKLGVNGDIAATKVKVALYNNWPDYVFGEAYELPTLEEVEAHINEKGHLQNVPSAKEVAKNGFFLEEMNAKLLQKIEELTLYTIAQEKEIKDLQSVKIKNKELEARLEKIEALLVK